MPMPQVMVGWALMVVGFAFILLGFAGAVQNMLPKPKVRALGTAGDVDYLRALTELVKALSTAPLWLGCTVIGIILIIMGSRFGCA